MSYFVQCRKLVLSVLTIQIVKRCWALKPECWTKVRDLITKFAWIGDFNFCGHLQEGFFVGLLRSSARKYSLKLNLISEPDHGTLSLS